MVLKLTYNLINLVCVLSCCTALLSERLSISRETSSTEIPCINKNEQGLAYCRLSEGSEIFSANLDPISLKYY